VVLANSAITEDGSVAHVWVGWVGLALLALRFVWGLVGTSEARFSAFPPNPIAAVGHLRALRHGEHPSYRSHNPAGALAAYAMWATLAVLIGTGIAMTGTGPIAAAQRAASIESEDWSTLDLGGRGGDDGEEDGGEMVEEVHEVAANLILLLALLHVAGVAVESRLMRRNLLRPMMTGDRTGVRRS
jgi:cytochrome b